MNDQSTMENILLTTKGVCDLYLHGTIESANQNVHQAFSAALNQTLSMQDSIYQQMAQRGWYATEQESQQKIQAVKQKFTTDANG